MSKLRFLIGVCSLCMSVVSANLARGDVVVITSPGQLQVDGTIDWNSFGPEGTHVAPSFLSTAPISGLPGEIVAVEGGHIGDFIRVDQGSAWQGSFPSGTALLSTDNTAFGGSRLTKPFR